jgi:hypothetical protein
MVGIKTLKEYNFNNLQDYFDYIDMSRINGQFDQSENLINKLSLEQKKQAIKYFRCLMICKETENLIISNL